ncbi:hypothetical protein GCM10010221_58220 [Streptomyces parvus]|nr:hypothetical protein GCM10010221_58220 [Streptomyces parvus]
MVLPTPGSPYIAAKPTLALSGSRTNEPSSRSSIRSRLRNRTVRGGISSGTAHSPTGAAGCTWKVMPPWIAAACTTGPWLVPEKSFRESVCRGPSPELGVVTRCPAPAGAWRARRR